MEGNSSQDFLRDYSFESDHTYYLSSNRDQNSSVGYKDISLYVSTDVDMRVPYPNPEGE
jgi:hypothetical protein